jgi:hypothetical protein
MIMDPQNLREPLLLGNQTTPSPAMYSINAMPVYIPPQPQPQEPIYFLRIENSAIIELKDTARWRAYCSTKTTGGWFSKKTLYLIKVQWYDMKTEEEKVWTAATTSLQSANTIMKSIYEQLDSYRRSQPRSQ